MRKINKEILFATQYKEWIESNPAFEKYDANFRFHKDILYQLLICQKGLCAYSEKLILEKEEVEKCKNDFVKGRYNKTNYEIAVDLEHFDSTLKTTTPWLWSNFFAVDRDINQAIKRVREEQMKKKYNGKGVHDILKPDLDEYNPAKLLAYDWKEHLFVPNNKTYEKGTNKIVEDMIYVLGLNYGFVKRQRKAYLELFLEKYKSKKETEPEQYITAFDMYKSEL